MIKAELVTIGDEILYGQIVDTNTQFMSVALDKIGVKVVRKSTVGDAENDILQVLKEAEKRADIILITGGLGPTNDDLTKPCLAKYFNSGLSLHPQALQDVTEFFERRGRELTALNRKQAELPDECEIIRNPIGTAPGMWFEKEGKVFVSMPGVPHEMKKMMKDEVIPRILKIFPSPVIYHKIVHTIGMGESFLSEKISDWEESLPENIKLAYLPSLAQVKLRLTATGEHLPALIKQVDAEIGQLKELIADYIFGYDNDTLSSVIGQILKEKNKTLAIAESCSGGFASHMITSVPGSSAYFKGGMVTYANEAKIKQLGLKAETIDNFGAVSEETVKEMAENVRVKMNTDYGLASSGIAGPDGGTPEKPVGLVWIAFADKNRTVAKKLMLSQDRSINIQYTAIALLNLLRIQMNRD